MIRERDIFTSKFLLRLRMTYIKTTNKTDRVADSEVTVGTNIVEIFPFASTLSSGFGVLEFLDGGVTISYRPMVVDVTTDEKNNVVLAVVSEVDFNVGGEFTVELGIVLSLAISVELTTVDCSLTASEKVTSFCVVCNRKKDKFQTMRNTVYFNESIMKTPFFTKN